VEELGFELFEEILPTGPTTLSIPADTEEVVLRLL
jgi:hypothetical protein